MVLLSLALTSASAQRGKSVFDIDEAEPRAFYGGLTAGANFSQVDGDGYSGYHRVGLHAGALVYARIKGPLFMSVEMLFAQKGSKNRYFSESPNTGLGIQEYDLRLNYAEVPVMLHLNYKPRFTGGAGISYARLISSKEEAFNNYPVNLHPDVNYFNKEDWCFLAQMSYEFWEGWLITMRYGYSLGSIRDPQRIPQNYGGGDFAWQKNNLFTIRFVFFFRGKSPIGR